MKCNIIGAGRLGKNIALALATKGIVRIGSICNTTPSSAQKASQELGLGIPVERLEQLQQSDITWITCNDDSIQLIVEQLSQLAILKPGSIVIHCSGVLNSSILSPLKSQGCSIASMHPLKAFKTDYLSPEAFQNVHCIFEGDTDACDWIRHSFDSLGAKIVEINPGAKAGYHAAACMASNYLITLAACSEELLTQTGIHPDHVREMIVELMQGNINNVQNSEKISESLTGPLMRGDELTLSMHLQAIENPLIKSLYKAAGLATIPLTQLDDNKKMKIKNIFSK